MSYDVQVRDLPAVPLAVVRRKAAARDLPRVVTADCGLVWQFVRAQQLRGGRHVAIYWDGVINLDVGVEIDVPFTPGDDVVAGHTPAGLAAVTVHYGPYGQLGAAHAAVRDWCRAHGLALAGPSWDVYGHWDPAWDADPSRIRTDVFYQLEPA